MVMRLGLVIIVLSGCSAGERASAQAFPRGEDIAAAAGPTGDLAVPEGAPLITPEDDITVLQPLFPPGTTFLFSEGVHRLTAPITPRDGDTYQGLPGAVLNGSVVLNGFERDDSGFWRKPHELDTRGHYGTCREDYPRCQWPQEVFLDDMRLRHVATLAELAPGSWTYQDGAVWLADDPGRNLVEISVTPGAIVGDADSVTVRNLTVEKFANYSQRAAIYAEKEHAGNATYGENWLIENNHVRLVHSVGIRASHGARILRNRITNNGQLGVASFGKGPVLIEGNEIAFNNEAGFYEWWEAGGSKFMETSDLTVRGNYVHRNRGPGLWTDYENDFTIYVGNVVEHNTGTGIFHEISRTARIIDNVSRFNGIGMAHEDNRYMHVYGAGILIADSPGVEVTGNLVEHNWHGIVGLNQDRGDEYLLRNLHVHSNRIGLDFHPRGVGPQGEVGIVAVAGLVDDMGIEAIFSVEWGNRFRNNSYEIEVPDGQHFAWSHGYHRWETWNSCGYEGRSSWPTCEPGAEQLVSSRP